MATLIIDDVLAQELRTQAKQRGKSEKEYLEYLLHYERMTEGIQQAEQEPSIPVASGKDFLHLIDVED